MSESNRTPDELFPEMCRCRGDITEPNPRCPIHGAQQREDLYYLQDTRATVGNSMLFWRVRGEGYTTDVREAATYTKDQAFRQHATRATDRPWRKAYIDARIKPHIDIQTCNYGERGSI